jgi:type I restriction enzyme M protein
MGEQPDTATLRRALSARHRDLRAAGQNPIDALRTVSEELLNDASWPSSFGAELMLTAFQDFLTNDLRGAFGQYLTPPQVAVHVAQLARGSARAADIVMDPFAGSGILLDAMSPVPGAKLVGCEINPTVARVGEISTALTGHHAEITVGDAFACWAAGELPSVDIVVTNPPFGAHLKTIDVAKLPSGRVRSSVLALAKVPVEVLAIELSLDRLVTGGRLVAVLPLSVLTNRTLSDYRRELFAEHRLVHVTALPEQTFAPFRGVANACVVVIDKMAPPAGPYPVTFETSRSVGYDATGRAGGPEADLEAIADRFGASSSPRRWLVAGDLVDHDPAGSRHPDAHLLGEIADVFVGKTPDRDVYVDTGPFLLKVGGLSGSFVSWRERTRSHVPRAFFLGNPAKHLRPGDICFTCSAHTPKYIAQKVDLITALPPEGAMASREVMVVRLRPDAPIDAVALLYYLRGDAGQAAMQRLVRGSTAHLYARDVEQLQVPPLDPSVDADLLRRRHSEAEAAFRTYLRLEDEISQLLRS